MRKEASEVTIILTAGEAAQLRRYLCCARDAIYTSGKPRPTKGEIETADELENLL